MPNKKYLSKIVKSGETLYVKDIEAQADIADIKTSITGGMHYRGKSTTAIADGDATGPWVIDGVTYVVSGATGEQKNLAAGDIAIYGELEFIWSGAAGKWQEFGSTGSLKALAFKDSAEGTITPAGTNAPSAVSFEGQTSSNFVTGYNDDAVDATFSEGAFTPASLGAGFYSAGTAPSYQEGQFTPASLASGFVTPGSAATYSHSGFSGGSLGDATTSNFATAGETSSYDATNETLTFSDASTSAAVTAQGTFTPAVYGTDTFDGGTPTAVDVTKFDGGSKVADTWNAGTMASIDITKFNGGSKASDTFTAGSAATLATASAVTAVGTGTAAAQVFTGTEATVTVE